MASSHIASMHTFLEMKKKFPDVPEDTLRGYVILYSNDQDRATDLLHKETKNFHSKRIFSESADSTAQLTSQHNNDLNDNPSQNNTPGLTQSNMNTLNELPSPNYSVRSSSHAGVIKLPTEMANLNISQSPMARSAPVVSNQKLPFVESYHYLPISSHTVPFNSDTNANQMTFSTTAEHNIAGDQPSIHRGQDSTERHTVSLSLTPSFPFQQQQLNMYSAKPASPQISGHHTTSVNFQLCPPSSNQHPLEISSIPTWSGLQQQNYQDYSSHMQISLDGQSTTFTALRFQRSPVLLPKRDHASSPTLTNWHRQRQSLSPMPEQGAMSPDQSSLYFLRQSSNLSKSPGDFTPNYALHPQTQELEDRSRPVDWGGKSFDQGYQASPAYVSAVKQHQVAQVEQLQGELTGIKENCMDLRSEVNQLEHKLLQRQDKEIPATHAEVLKKLKEENRKLRLECNCLLMEYDLSSKGQIPVGVTDEDFYSNIFTGPNDGLLQPTTPGRRNSSRSFFSCGAKNKTSSEEDDDIEKNRWICKKCTFANYPALDKCEMCEIPKNSGSMFDDS